MKRNFSYSMIGNLISALCKFLILFTIIRIGNPEDVGKYNFALALTAPLFLLLSFKSRTIIVTNDQYKPNDFFYPILITNLILAVTVTTPFLLMSDFSTAVSVGLISLIKTVENLKEIVYGVYQKNENLRLLSISLIIYSFLSLLLFSVTYYIFENLLLSLLFYLISTVLSFVLIDFHISFKYYSFKLRVKKKRQDLISLFLLSIPLSLSSSLGSWNTNIPRIFLKFESGEYYLGIFSSIAYMLVVVSLIVNSISQTFLPRLRKYYRQKQYDLYKELTKKMVLIGVSLGLSITIFNIIFGKYILEIVYGNEYAIYSHILIVLSTGMTFLVSGVFLGTSIVATGIYNIHYKITLITLMVTILSSFILVPNYSINGTAITVLISNFTNLICYYYFYSRNKIKIGV